MPRSLALALVFACSASAGIWPQKLGKYQLKSATVVNVAAEDRAELLGELGLEGAEDADYGRFQVRAEKFRDTTGAYAASLEPAREPRASTYLIGNYVISCRGNCPKDLQKLAFAALPSPSHSAVPTLSTYLPAKGLIPHSERHIVGPVGLRTNAPQIPESTVAFPFGTEGEFALYKAPGGDQALVIFAFPTPQMARQQVTHFEDIPNVDVKRSGPLVAIVVPPASRAGKKSTAALELLSQVNYAGSVAWNQPMPLIVRPQTMAQILVGIFMLAGVVIGFCVVSGLAFALIRILARKFGYSDAQNAMTTLHLGGK